MQVGGLFDPIVRHSAGIVPEYTSGGQNFPRGWSSVGYRCLNREESNRWLCGRLFDQGAVGVYKKHAGRSQLRTARCGN